MAHLDGNPYLGGKKMDNKNIKFEDIKPKKVSLPKIQAKLEELTKQLMSLK